MQPIAFTDGRTVPSAAVTKLMAEMLELSPKDKLLEIGTGSGTQTEVWAQSGCEVHSIELKPVLTPERLSQQVYLHSGDGKKGLPQEAPFTAIVATCGMKEIPKRWEEQLSEDGRLLAPLGDSRLQKLTLFRKVNGAIEPRRIGGYVRFLMME